MHTTVYMHMNAGDYRLHMKGEDRSSGVAVTGDREPPDVVAGVRSQVLYKNTKYS